MKGDFSVYMGKSARINHTCRFSATGEKETESILKLGDFSNIICDHLFDMTSSIAIGQYTVLGGSGTQIWTHGFYVSRTSDRVKRNDGNVTIGSNCYIGSRCCVCASVNIGDGITVGAQTVVSKSLVTEGLYVSQPVRYIDFDPDQLMHGQSAEIMDKN